MEKINYIEVPDIDGSLYMIPIEEVMDNKLRNSLNYYESMFHDGIVRYENKPLIHPIIVEQIRKFIKDYRDSHGLTEEQKKYIIENNINLDYKKEITNPSYIERTKEHQKFLNEINRVFDTSLYELHDLSVLYYDITKGPKINSKKNKIKNLFSKEITQYKGETDLKKALSDIKEILSKAMKNKKYAQYFNKFDSLSDIFSNIVVCTSDEEYISKIPNIEKDMGIDTTAMYNKESNKLYLKPNYNIEDIMTGILFAYSDKLSELENGEILAKPGIGKTVKDLQKQKPEHWNGIDQLYAREFTQLATTALSRILCGTVNSKNNNSDALNNMVNFMLYYEKMNEDIYGATPIFDMIIGNDKQRTDSLSKMENIVVSSKTSRNFSNNWVTLFRTLSYDCPLKNPRQFSEQELIELKKSMTNYMKNELIAARTIQAQSSIETGGISK